MAKKAKKKKGSILGKIAITLAVLVILAGAVLAAGIVVLDYLHGKSNYVSDDSVTLDANYMAFAKQEEGFDENDYVTLAAEEAEELEIQFGKLAEEAADKAEDNRQGTYNLLLIGSDRRSENWYGNSDAIILCTINHNTKKIHLTSFMRDLYANIPGGGVRKLNAAHALGGGPLLAATLQSNYGVIVDNYASINFNSMAAIIDMLGGVVIDVSVEEAGVMRGYIEEICSLAGANPANYYVQGGGVCHLNGIQAVAYMRIRYVGRADYERTQRQREVLTSMIATAKGLSVGSITNFVNQVMPLITHNVSQETILNLLASVPDIITYDVVNDRVPYDGLYYSSNEMLIPDLGATITRLHSTLYAK